MVPPFFRSPDLWLVFFYELRNFGCNDAKALTSNSDRSIDGFYVNDQLNSLTDWLSVLGIAHGDDERGGFIEMQLYNQVHGWTGGDMGVFGIAGYDPIFYSYHSNVDHLWAK